MTIYRQGDVLLRKVRSIPASKPVQRDRGRVVLAYGEVTGHAHVIEAPEATLLTTAENERFLRLMATVELTHEEHATVTLPKGNYQVVIQREWTDEMEPRRVLD